MVHIFNCHGEWLLLFAAFSALPVVGAYVRAWIASKRNPDSHEDGERVPLAGGSNE